MIGGESGRQTMEGGVMKVMKYLTSGKKAKEKRGKVERIRWVDRNFNVRVSSKKIERERGVREEICMEKMDVLEGMKYKCGNIC